MKYTQKLILFVIALLPACATLADEAIYQKALRSTVWVINGDSTGTGTLIDADQNLIVTNYHLVRKSSTVHVVFPSYEQGSVVGERRFYFENLHELAVASHVVATDPKRDLALITVESLPEQAVALELAERDASPGQAVHSIGNPGVSDALWVYGSGTVRMVYSATMLFPNGLVVHAQVVETQVPINPGDSGGPVVNDRGKLVAITQSVRADGVLVAKCIAVSELRDLLSRNDKVTHGKAPTGHAKTS